jgi:hypothetical protein
MRNNEDSEKRVLGSWDEGGFQDSDRELAEERDLKPTSVCILVGGI